MSMIENILREKYGEYLKGLDIYENKSSLVLSRIVIKDEYKNTGVGTKVMQDLIEYADTNKQIIALTPASDFGGNKNRLIQFYKRFGFKLNQGSYKSFEFREAMIRYPKMNENTNSLVKTLLREHLNVQLRVNILTEGISYKVADETVFKDILLDLATLDLEDGQVRYPSIEGREKSFLFGGNEYDLFILNKTELPSSGPFELVITDNDENVIGFIRGTKGDNIISFNLIHIQDTHRGTGIGTDIYEKFLEKGFVIKSDKEITDATYSMYTRLLSYGYKPLIFADNTVGLVKNVPQLNEALITQPAQYETIQEFVKFAMRQLGIKGMIRLTLQKHRNNLTTTASFDTTGHIRVYIKDRALVDVLRSIAHEMVHLHQMDEGRITDPETDGADGSPIENEANSMAGILIRKYGRVNPKIYI